MIKLFPMNSDSDRLSLRNNELEAEVSRLRNQLSESLLQKKDIHDQCAFYKLIADFTLDWEFWLYPDGKFVWCSPSCFSLTGYTSEQIVSSSSFIDMLIAEVDRQNFSEYLSESLNLTILNPMCEFRILTRSKQIRWCEIKSGAVYDKQGKYLGMRASVRDITRLKSALGHIREMDNLKQVDSRIRERLKSDLESKDRELVDTLIQLSRKNEIISFVRKYLEKMMNSTSQEVRKNLEVILNNISKSDKIPFDWHQFDQQVERNHPGFFERLQMLHQRLTQKDKRLCACLRLSLTSKEIANLMEMEPASVEIARVRLRKKLRINPDERLTRYLSSI